MTTKTVYLRDETGAFVCPTCGVTKARQNTMFYHMKKHTGDLKYACDHCDSRFVQKSALDQHVRQAHSVALGMHVPVWSCPCCDHTCRVKANLIIHIGRKHGEGWIPPATVTTTGCVGCPGCSRTFTSVTAYYYHAVGCFAAPEKLTVSLDGGSDA